MEKELCSIKTNYSFALHLLNIEKYPDEYIVEGDSSALGVMERRNYSNRSYTLRHEQREVNRRKDNGQ